jgi:3-oxoadipyl-CoA thiolase
MRAVFVCDAIRTPIGRYGGALSQVRTDDLAAVPLKALMARNARVDWQAIDDVYYGCVNQAGEDNRNVARMALLLAGLPQEVAGMTVNRLCGSGMSAVAAAACAIASGDAEIVIAGGVESMSRAPFVLPKSTSAFSRHSEIYDTTIGWRFVNPEMERVFGTDSMPQTAENLAELYGISRADQDKFACRSQAKALAAKTSGRFTREITPVAVALRKGAAVSIEADEHPRETTIEALAALKPVTGTHGTVTAGNAAGINDGAAAIILASEAAARTHGLTPRARVIGSATAGVKPRVMGIGPVPATRNLLLRLGKAVSEIDYWELNEAFAAQALAVLRELGLPDEAPHVNTNGGAIALGHPLGMSGARLIMTAVEEIAVAGHASAVCTMCIGVGQGIAFALEAI